MSFKEAVKRYQSYIPTLIIGICTWVFSNIGTAVIASINDFKNSYGQMKTDIKDLKTELATVKETGTTNNTLISHAQERELSIEKRIDDNKSSADIKFAQLFIMTDYLRTKN